SPNSHLSSSQGGAAAKRRCRPWDPCLNIAAALGAGRKTPFLRRARLHRSGMDPRVKPEDDDVGGAALVRKSPPRKKSIHLPSRRPTIPPLTGTRHGDGLAYGDREEPGGAETRACHARRHGRDRRRFYLPLVGRSAVVRRPGGGHRQVSIPTRRFAST